MVVAGPGVVRAGARTTPGDLVPAQSGVPEVCGFGGLSRAAIPGACGLAFPAAGAACGGQGQVVRTMEMTVQVAESLSLAGFGSAGLEAVRVAVTAVMVAAAPDRVTEASLTWRGPV